MDGNRFLTILPQFLVLIPAAISCYFPVHHRMKYTPSQTAALCLAALLPYSFLCAWLCAVLRLDTNVVILPSLVLVFFLYRHTVLFDLPRCLAVYVGVCAIQSFPSQFSYAFDSFLHPMSNPINFSAEAAFFQLGISCLLAAVFAYPACHWFAPIVSRLDIPKIWYSTVILSAVFLAFNVLAIPHSYRTLRAGRLSYLFPLLEICLLAVLVAVYVLFYWNARILLEHAELKERSHLLEIQVRQYRALQEHIRQTAILRHDFRHSVRLLSSLAKKGDIDSIRSHLAEYEDSLSKDVSRHYCANTALNALFGYYHEMAVSANIRVDWHIELPDPLLAAELDMACLFGNLMENAIDGCLTVPEEKRYFCLATEICHGNQLYIVSTNSFDGHTRKGAGGLHSTKHSGKGTGLISMSAIAEKYGGALQASNNEREFFTDVVLKI